MSHTKFPTNHGIHFILDWDGTVTQKDTLDALVDMCKITRPAAEISSIWTCLTESYMADYEATIKECAPEGKLPTSIPEERKLLLVLEAVEQRSIDRVIDSGLFNDLTPQHIKSGADKAMSTKQIQLRYGYLDFENHLRSRNARYGPEDEDQDIRNFLSVTWCRFLIASCLDVSSVDPLSLGQIYANELEDGIITRARVNPEGKIISSNDKLKTMKRLQQWFEPKPVVYVGDSWTDLECLLAADLGICMQDDPISSTQRKLAEALERLNVHCPHIREWESVDEHRVVWVRDFDEIRAWVSEVDHRA